MFTIQQVFLDKRAEEYQTISMNSSSQVNSDLVFDAKRDHLYVVTGKQVIYNFNVFFPNLLSCMLDLKMSLKTLCIVILMLQSQYLSG